MLPTIGGITCTSKNTMPFSNHGLLSLFCKSSRVLCLGRLGRLCLVLRSGQLLEEAWGTLSQVLSFLEGLLGTSRYLMPEACCDNLLEKHG